MVSTGLVSVSVSTHLIPSSRKGYNSVRSVGGGGVMSESNNGRVSKSVLDSAREELEGRTGLTDSEDEGAGDEVGDGE